ncbi:chromosome segregation protein SMC, partial [Staphylococcus caprae]
YTQLSKEGKASTHQTQQQLHQKQSDLAVVKERIKSQKQVYERLDKQLSDSERQKIEVNEKIKLFNSDEMMGKDAFEKLKEQIQQQENVRQNLNQQLSEIKQQRKDLNEKIEINESQLQK